MVRRYRFNTRLSIPHFRILDQAINSLVKIGYLSIPHFRIQGASHKSHRAANRLSIPHFRIQCHNCFFTFELERVFQFLILGYWLRIRGGLRGGWSFQFLILGYVIEPHRFLQLVYFQFLILGYGVRGEGEGWEHLCLSIPHFRIPP